MSRSLSPNAQMKDVIAAVRALATEIDSVRNGNFTIRGDLNLNNNRLRNVGRGIEYNDAAIRGDQIAEDFAPVDAAFVVAGNLDPRLTRERLAAVSSGLTLDDNGAGSTLVWGIDQAFFDALYAPIAGAFVTIGSSGTLTGERALTAGAGITITDGGANSTVTVAATLGSGGAQPYDAFLTSIATLGTAADKMIYTTGIDTAAETALTAAARTVLDDTTVDAMLTTLGGAAYTGSGGVVRATSPTLVTPTLGVATATSVQQATNNSGGFLGKPTSGTNDYSLFVNSSNEWELRQNVGGVVNATYKWGGAEFYPGAKENLGKTTAGWGAVVFQGATSGDATLQPPAVAGSGTVLTLPGATGTLATLDGTETLTNKTLTSPSIASPVIAGSGIDTDGGSDVGDLGLKSFSIRELNNSASNGNNNNFDLSTFAYNYITGPTTGFTFTGFLAPTGTYPGGVFKIITNGTGQNMTIAHESASSTAANRITTNTGADVVTAAQGSAIFVYSNTASRWILISSAL